MAQTEVTVGQRIRRLRERAGLSQEQLAGRVSVARPAITQLEADRRKLSAEELVRMAGLFGVSCDVLLGLEQEPKVVLPRNGSGIATTGGGMRISVPQRNLDKFREVLLLVLSRVGAKPHVGETVIYKLLYFMDFDYYEKYEEQFIGATYIANQHGPTPVEFRKIVERMQADGDLIQVKDKYFQYDQRKYLPRREPDTSVLSGRELEVVEDVLARLGDMNATAISAWSHGDLPWRATQSGGAIEYETVFYRTAPYSQREYPEED